MDAQGELLQLQRSPLVDVLGRVAMTEMGETVVAELCDLVADVIDVQPAAAAKVARRLATSIRSQQTDYGKRREVSEQLEERRLKLDEQLVAKGKRPLR